MYISLFTIAFFLFVAYSIYNDKIKEYQERERRIIAEHLKEVSVLKESIQKTEIEEDIEEDEIYDELTFDEIDFQEQESTTANLIDGALVLMHHLFNRLNFKLNIETINEKRGIAAISKDDLAIKLKYTGRLALVGYYVGEIKVRHEKYIELLGKQGQNKFPCTSTDPKDEFSALFHDLRFLLTDFTENDAQILRAKYK